MVIRADAAIGERMVLPSRPQCLNASLIIVSLLVYNPASAADEHAATAPPSPQVIENSASETADAASDRSSLNNPWMVTLPAGELRLGEAVRLLRDDGQQRILLGLGVHGGRTVMWPEEQTLPWWQAVDRVAEAFELSVQSVADAEMSEEDGGWMMVHHHHRRSPRRENESISATLRTQAQAIALGHGETTARHYGRATFGPWRLITDELVHHEARMLSGTQRWVEIPYHIMGEPRFAEQHEVRATVTWKEAESASGGRRPLGEPSINDMRSAHRTRMVRRHRNHQRNAQPETSATLVVGGLRSDDRSITLSGEVQLQEFQRWQQEAELVPQQWQDIETPDGDLRVLLHRDRELDEALFADLNLSTGNLQGPAIVWVVQGRGRTVPEFTVRDALGREIRNDGARSTSRRPDSTQSLMSLRMVGDMDGPFTLNLSAMTASQAITLPLRVEVPLP